MHSLRILFFLFFPILLSAQTTGRVLTDDNEALIGATVFWQGTNIGTTTNETGSFSIEKSPDSQTLIATFVGYMSDSILVKNQEELTFRLKESGTLEEVIVKEKGDDVTISNLQTIKSENIGEGELKKAACCDLAGCFETQITVSPQTTNVITNAKELRINGLAGVYNQVLINNFPMIQGLSFTYGISSVPGTQVQNIFVAKGANSVLQGYESISGQINVLTKNPAETDKLLLNAYINSFGEKQLNANLGFKVGKWSNLLVAHTTQPAGIVDRDDDGFLEVPQISRYMISDTWKIGKETEWGWSSEIGLRYLNENRAGGQVSFDPDTDQGSNTVYGQTVQLSQPEVYSKTTYRFNDKHAYSGYASALYQNQNSYFGTVKYDAEQVSAYFKLQYEYDYSDKSQIRMGASMRAFDLKENVEFTDNSLGRDYDGAYQRDEYIPGVFAENTLKFLKGKATWMLGLRADHHDDFGTRVTPRTLLKYDIDERTSLRANVGTGWRTVNLFPENINLLVSSRNVVFAEPLKPEEAINYGINITRKFDAGDMTGYFTADYYRTEFQNQIFPDYDTDPTLAIIQNYSGTAISNGLQAEVFCKFFKTLEFKAGYNFLDVYRMTDGEKQLLPFNARHKVVLVGGYRPLSEKWSFDMNFHWHGQQRLPDTSSNPEEFQRPDFSGTFTLLNAQFGYNIKRFELYAGCENILDFRQKRPIIGWQNPFGEYFDTSSVWGPVRGRELYFGVRYRIEK